MRMVFNCLLQVGLLLSLAFVANAAVEPLPELKSDEDKKEFLMQWQRQIPFSSYANLDFLNRQINSLAALRKQFPDYDKWMAAKPDPIVIDVFRVEKTTEQSLALETATLEHVREFTTQHFLNEIKAIGQSQITTESLAALEQRAYVTLSEVFKGSGESVRGIIVGLAQLLPPQERGAFFKIGDAHQQIDVIARLNIGDETLRQSSFRPEVLGLTKETLAFAKLIETARRRVQGTDRIFLTLSYIKFLQRLNSAEFLNQMLDAEKLKFALHAHDFDFAHKQSSEFNNQVLEQMSNRQLAAGTTVQQQLTNFQNNFSRLRFVASPKIVSHNKLVAKVYEVLPHLGAHRGCIGGDCSTSTSPMFPFSPWEHDFLIQSPEGAFIGYVSATRVLSEGIETFYLKDLSGRTLSAPVAEAVLHAFARIYPYYGAKRFAIASPKFTDGQNHFQILINMLKRYNREGRSVPLEFPDKPIRTFIGANYAVFASATAYDSTDAHSRGVLFPSFPEIEAQYSAQYKKGTLPVPDLKSIGENLIHLLRVKAANPNVEVHGVGLSTNEIHNALSIVQNDGGLELEKYYKNVTALFAKYQIELNKSFLTKNEALFLRGHLLAKDAFDNKDESLLATSDRYFSQLARSHVDYALLMKVASKWKEKIEKRPRTKELFQLYAERVATYDVFQLYGFSEIGFKQATKILKNPAVRPRIDQAIETLLNSQPTNFGLPTFQEIRNKKYQSIGQIYYAVAAEPVTYANHTIKSLTERLDAAFAPFGFDWRKIESSKFRNLVELAFIRQVDSMNEIYRPRVVQLLKNHIQNGTASYLDVLEAMKRLIDYPKEFNELAEIYFEKVRQFQEPIDYGILHLFAAWEYKPALDLIKNSEVRKSYIQFLENHIFGGDGEIVTRSNTTRMANLYNVANAVNPFNVAIKLQYPGTTVTAVNNRIRDVARDLRVSTEDLKNSPRFARYISSSWLNLRDVFTSPDPAVIETTLKILSSRISESNYMPNDRFFNSIDYIKQHREFNTFVTKLENAFLNEGCVTCGDVLVLLIAMEKIPNRISDTPEKVSRLVSMQSNVMPLFGAFMAKQNRIQLTLPENTIYRFALEMDQKVSWIPAKLRPLFREWTIESLMHYPNSGNEYKARILKILESKMMQQPIDATALKLGLAFIKQGGNPYYALTSLTRIYPRLGLTIDPSTQDAELYKRFLAATQPIPNAGSNLTCKAVFEKRKL